jgi:hypothetical protein
MKMETQDLLKLTSIRGEEIKENNGGGEFFLNVTMYPQYNNNMIILKFKKENTLGPEHAHHVGIR